MSGKLAAMCAACRWERECLADPRMCALDKARAVKKNPALRDATYTEVFEYLAAEEAREIRRKSMQPTLF